MRGFSSSKSAREKAMDYLARRGHSELELRRKLKRRYEPDEIEKAITYVRDHGWMAKPEVLAEELTRQLGRRKKSHRYIENSLRSKGLPVVSKDAERELEKARDLAHSKLDKGGPFDYEEKKKIHRLLTNRGFDPETIKKVMHEKPTDQ